MNEQGAGVILSIIYRFTISTGACSIWLLVKYVDWPLIILKRRFRIMKKILVCIIFASLAFNSGGAIAAKKGKQASVPAGLDTTEASHLTFMREEEKLARDVYLTLAALYPDQGVFSRIATRAEQTHTDTMRDKLDQYNLPDPNPETNNLPSSLGVFTGDEWGWYFMDKFALLTAKGGVSELDALYVGAFIEELDMHDIAICPQVMIDRGFSSPCGLAYTDEGALQTAYSALISGSESHLRSYVGQIEAVIGVGNYVAQYLTQAEIDAILER